MICKIEISVSRGPLGMSDHTIIEMETLEGRMGREMKHRRWIDE